MNNEFEEKKQTKKNLNKRLDRLRNILQNEPDNLEIKLSILRCLLFLRRFDEAYKECIIVLDTSPENPIALWVLGIIYTCQHEFEKSEECLQKVVRLLPEFMVAHIDLGFVLISRDKIEEGVQEINKGIELNQFYWRGHYNLCNVYMMQKQLKNGFYEAKLAWKYRKSFKTLTYLITTYDGVTKLWTYWMAIAFDLLAMIVPSPFTLLLLILGSGRLSISAFGIILYGNKKAGGYFIYAWVVSMIILFILRYNKIV